MRRFSVILAYFLICGWFVVGLSRQAHAIDELEEEKWNQLLRWIDDYDPVRKPAGRLLNAARAMKHERFEYLMYQVSQQGSELLPKIDPDMLPDNTQAVLEDLVAWYQARGGLGVERCIDLGEVNAITLQDLGRLALATASSRAGDKQVAAVLYLADQLRRRGTLVPIMAGMALNHSAILLLKNGDLAYGPEWKRLRPKEEEFFFAVARDTVCQDQEIRKVTQSENYQPDESELALSVRYGYSRSRRISELLAGHASRKDLDTLKLHFKDIPKTDPSFDFYPNKIVRRLINEYKKTFSLYNQVLVQQSTQRDSSLHEARTDRTVVSNPYASKTSKNLEPVAIPKLAEKIGDNKWRINRRAFLSLTEDKSNPIAIQARIVPAFEQGDVIGFRIFKIRPNSVYDQLGIENRDIILTVAEIPITHPEKAIEAYEKLKANKEFKVDLLRRGKRIQRTYLFR